MSVGGIAMARQVHLVGSVGLDTVGDVFATCGSLLGPYLKRVPDGEPGGRRLWISWQFAVLRANPYLQPDTSQHRSGGIGFHPMKLAEGIKRSEERRVGRGCRDRRRRDSEGGRG